MSTTRSKSNNNPPPPTTPQPAASSDPFQHIMDVIFGRPTGSNLYEALVICGVEDLPSLLSMTEPMIGLLYYTVLDTQTNQRTSYAVKENEKNLIRLIIQYHQGRVATGDPIKDWLQVTKKDFDDFRMTPTTLLGVAPIIPNTPLSKSSPVVSGYPTPPPGPNPVDLFRRGIKRDPTVFPILKDERFNDQWHRSFTIQANAQGVSDVLDPKYKAPDSTAQALFDEKQKFLFAVLDTKVLTDKGKAILRKYEATSNAQMAYADLLDHHLKSTKASMSSSTILSYLSSTKITDGNWHGTTEGYILNWQDKVRLYERLVDHADRLSDGNKRIMLQNAVHGLEDLRQVKNTADLLKAAGKDITFDQYVSLLLSAAAAYDIHHSTKPKGKRQVFTHDFIPIDEDINDEDLDDEPYDIDHDLGTLQAYASFQPKSGNLSQRVRMAKDKWFALDSKSKELWDQLDDKAKSIILGYSKPPIKPPGNYKPPGNFQPNPRFKPKPKVNLHEISAHEFLANIHDLQVNDGEEDDTPP